MIFSTKRSNAPGHSSNKEACVSILGLFLAIGIVGGLATLIYGLVKGNSSGTIGGGVVLGVSTLLSILLAVIFVYCLKNNNVNSNINESSSATNQHHHKQNHHHHHQNQRRPVKHEQASSREITVISGMYRYDNHPQQQPSNEYDAKLFSPSGQSNGLADSTNSGFGKQLPLSPSKTSPFVYLNQSNGSVNNQNYQLSKSPNPNRSNSNRH